MSILRISIDLERLGQEMSNMADIEQAAILNSFGLELKIVCKDILLTKTQPYEIAANLDQHGIDLIKSLYEFIKLREEAHNTPKL